VPEVRRRRSISTDCRNRYGCPARRGGTYAAAAAIFYSAVLTLASGSFTLLWLYLRAHLDLLEPDAAGPVGAAIRRSLAGPALYLVALVTAIVSARAALAVVTAIAVYFAVPYPAGRPVRSG
jgi:hypothetical protein